MHIGNRAGGLEMKLLLQLKVGFGHNWVLRPARCAIDLFHQAYVIIPAKLISGQHPALIWVLQSIEADDFWQFRKYVRQTAHLQLAQQKAQAFCDDLPGCDM